MQKKAIFTVISLALVTLSYNYWNSTKNEVISNLPHAHVQRNPASQMNQFIDNHTHGHKHNVLNKTKQRQDVKSLQQMTTSLIQLNRTFQKGSSKQRIEIKKKMLEQVQTRQKKMLSLIQTNPLQVIAMAIPTHKQQGFPKEVLAHMERAIELDGKMQSFYEDYADGNHVLRQYLNTPDKNQFELHFANVSTNLPIGYNVQARGIMVPELDSQKTKGHIALESQDKNIITLAADGDGATTADGTILLEAASTTMGQKNVLVILVNFQDDPENMPWSLDEVNNTVFTETNNFFLENSMGRTSLAGDTVGWFTLAMDSTDCDQVEMGNQAKLMASNSGVNLGNYQFFSIVFPRNACGWGGLGSLGNGTSGITWINGTAELFYFSHELGHNFGLWHSNALECGVNIAYGSECIVSAYADKLDTMGSKSGAHFNAYQKKNLGWLNDNTLGYLFSIEQSGTYNLGVHAFPTPQHPAALRVLKEVNPSTGEKIWYYMEYRQSVGFDSFIEQDARYMNIIDGIVFHTGSDSNRNSSSILDMTPQSSDYWDKYDVGLAVGKTYTDVQSGLEVTVDAVTSTHATVTVNMQAQPCVAAAPTLSIESAQSIWAKAGAAIEYQVSLTNNDNQNCDASLFNISTTVPVGWDASLTQSEVSLTPGDIYSFIVTVTSPTSALNRFYNIGINASNGLNIASTNVTYVVDTVDSIDPTITLIEPTAQDTVTAGQILNILAEAQDNVHVERVELYINDSFVSSDAVTPYQFSYEIPSKGRFKSFKIEVRAIDSSNNSASAIVTVNKSGDTTTSGGGGKGNGRNK